MTDFAEVYRRDLFDSVLPFWMKHSIDRVHGGFFSCLDREGSIYDPRKYVWLNGRQVWMLSKLYNECGPREEWLAAARGGAEFLRRHAFDSEGRCYFSLTVEGRAAAYQRKPYGAVFVALGWLEYAKASGEEWARQGAIELFGKIREWIRNPQLLGRPALSGAPAVSQLADVMVVTSLALELARDTGDANYDAILDECLASALLHLDGATGVLLENVSVLGEDLRGLPEGRLVCPGHSLEVCWFLLDVLERRPNLAMRTRVLEILAASVEYGWDAEYGGLFYFMDIEGKPALQLEAGMKLWWPHTEAIYALVRAWTLTGSEKWLSWLNKVHDYTYGTFPDPAADRGEWFGYCDRGGKPTHSLKGNSYKGCFHVPRALWLSLQRLQGS